MRVRNGVRIAALFVAVAVTSAGGALIVTRSAPAPASTAIQARQAAPAAPPVPPPSLPYRFAGLNVPAATTMWSVNRGCGTQIADLDSVFSAVPANGLIRVWAFQAMAVNSKTKKLDFTAVDRVFAAAERTDQKLIVVLSEQAGTCDDGHWHGADWYAGGFRKVYNDNQRGLNVMPFSDFLRVMLLRYRSSPALAMWELVNEPEAADCAAGRKGTECYTGASCRPDAPQVLRRFFDEVGRYVKRLDPAHRISSGVLGGRQCGLAGDGYAVVHASKGIDVATFHDYSAPDVVYSDELALRMRQSEELGKPLLVEEAGIKAAASVAGCLTLAQRRDRMAAKYAAALANGVDGFLPWVSVHTPQSGCGHDIGAGDPMYGVLNPQPSRFARVQ